jgi:hypothetical protein
MVRVLQTLLEAILVFVKWRWTIVELIHWRQMAFLRQCEPIRRWRIEVSKK